MNPNTEKLIFQTHPIVELCTNKFIGIPVVLQYDNTPLIEVIKSTETDFSTRIPIFHSDGTHLAVVVGAQLHLTPEGEKAGLVLRHPDRMTVCELAGQTLFEIKRTEAAAISASAELFTPDGFLVKCSDAPMPALIQGDDDKLQIGRVVMSGNTFQGGSIGIWIQSNGSISFGVA